MTEALSPSSRAAPVESARPCVTALRDRGHTIGTLDLSGATGADHAVGGWMFPTAPPLPARSPRSATELGPITALVTSAGYYEMALGEPDQHQSPGSACCGCTWAGCSTPPGRVCPTCSNAGSGAVVAVASELAVGGGDQDAHYAAAKGAILGLVRSLAAEVADRGVRVNAVAPGPTDTPLLADDSPGAQQIIWRPCRCGDWSRPLRWRAVCSTWCATPPSAPAMSSTSTRSGDMSSLRGAESCWSRVPLRAWVPPMRAGWPPRERWSRSTTFALGAALDALAAEIGGLAVPGDVRDPANCVEIADAVAEPRRARLDVLVANHAYMTMAPLLEHDEADWWRVVDTNLGGTFHLVQAVLPHMRRLGAGPHRRDLQRMGCHRLARGHAPTRRPRPG